MTLQTGEGWVTQASGATRYQGLRTTLSGATYGADMALVMAINLDTHIESEKLPF